MVVENHVWETLQGGPLMEYDSPRGDGERWTVRFYSLFLLLPAIQTETRF